MIVLTRSDKKKKESSGICGTPVVEISVNKAQ